MTRGMRGAAFVINSGEGGCLMTFHALWRHWLLLLVSAFMVPYLTRSYGPELTIEEICIKFVTELSLIFRYMFKAQWLTYVTFLTIQ
jgi:hypothetical protein